MTNAYVGFLALKQIGKKSKLWSKLWKTIIIVKFTDIEI